MDIWSWNNAIDASGVLLSSSIGSSGALVPTNVRDPRVGKIWRASGAPPVRYRITLPTTGSISIFGIFGHNYADIGAMTLKLGTGVGLGNLWQTTFEPNEIGPQAVFVLRDSQGIVAPVSATHATVETNTGAPLEIGRLWLGTADWQSEIGHNVDGSRWGSIDLSRKSRTSRSGAVLGDRGARLRTFTANYQALNESEYSGSLFEMDDKGTLQQMLFIPNPDVYDPNVFAVLGTLDEMPSSNWEGYMRAGRSITITEAG